MASSKRCRELQDHVGVGIRSRHYRDILAGDHPIRWFESLTENYLDTAGRPRHLLHQIVERYPSATHGVSLSIGSMPSYRAKYLDKLRDFVDEFDPFLVTDHLCWTATETHNTHDLLPMPWTDETLDQICRQVEHVQEALSRPIALENISQYVAFKDSQHSEWTFMNRLCARTGCGWLLDINNVFVNAFNFDFDPHFYLDQVQSEHVWQYHMAGHTDRGSYLFDTHVGPTPQAVLDLYAYAVKRIGKRPTLIEWDTDIPEFSVLLEDQARVQKILDEGVPWT